jgi:hypothetical protein
VKRGDRAVAVLVWACFAAFALCRSPVPGVNEPHYLCKAKHFYAPEWCARDMFLESANAHWVFYALAGAVTRIASLDTTAWIGRILVWAGLAYSWVRLARMLLPGRFSPLWAACLFLLLQAIGNLSGEWLIGGVEAKGFAYTALFLTIVATCDESYRLAAVEIGLAISFHPVVGAWGALALAASIAGRFIRSFLCRTPPVHGEIEAEPSSVLGVAKDAVMVPRRRLIRSRRWRSAAAPVLLSLVFSLPGLLPVCKMIASAPSKSAAHRADRIQVFDRLDHHLDPSRFSKSSYVMYAVLLSLWLALSVAGDCTEAQRFFTRFVLATLAFTLAGLIVGFWHRSPGLMKFYPFRLFDLFLPIAVSISGVGLLERVGPVTARAGFAMQRLLAAVAGPGVALVALIGACLAPGGYANPSGMQYQQNWLAFVDACRWVEKNTPRDALFLTVPTNVGFKWYAQRAEYVTIKDCPQDAAGILEWKDRRDLIADWRTACAEHGYTHDEFAVLGRMTGIDYALAWNSEPWHIEPVYQNRAISVYRLAK